MDIEEQKWLDDAWLDLIKDSPTDKIEAYFDFTNDSYDTIDNGDRAVFFNRIDVLSTTVLRYKVKAAGSEKVPLLIISLLNLIVESITTRTKSKDDLISYHSEQKLYQKIGFRNKIFTQFTKTKDHKNIYHRELFELHSCEGLRFTTPQRLEILSDMISSDIDVIEYSLAYYYEMLARDNFSFSEVIQGLCSILSESRKLAGVNI